MIIEVTQSSVLVGANNLDNTPDGTTYKRIAAALATAINNETRLPTALGTADANAIAAATGATLAARISGLLNALWALGGQDPGPKIRAHTANNYIGEMREDLAADGADLKTPNVVGGSTWAVLWIYGVDDTTSPGWKIAYDYPQSFPNNMVTSGNSIIVSAAGHPGKAVRAIMIRQA